MSLSAVYVTGDHAAQLLADPMALEQARQMQQLSQVCFAFCPQTLFTYSVLSKLSPSKNTYNYL